MRDPLEQPLEGFDNTHWSIVARAQDIDSSVRRAALNELLSIYYPALMAHLVLKKKIRDRQAAAELLQGFVTDKIVERDLVSQADPNKGKFRSLLLRSLENYLVDEARKESAQKRNPGVVQSLDAKEPGGAEALAVDADVFDAAWAKEVISEAVKRFHAHCLEREQPHVWEVFQHRILKPILDQRRPPSYEQLVSICRLESPSQATAAIKTAKNRFRKTLRAVVGQYTLGDQNIEDELAGLKHILSRSGALGLEESFVETNVDTKDPNEESSLDVSSRPLPRLASIFDRNVGAREERLAWSEKDLGAIHRHLMSLPLSAALLDLGMSQPEAAELLAGRPFPGRPLAGTGAQGTGASDQHLLADGLLGEHAPLELLIEIKRQARTLVKSEQPNLPPEIAQTVYYTAIAAALVRHGERITKLAPQKAAGGFRCIMRYDWLDERSRSLMEKAAAALEEMS